MLSSLDGKTSGPRCFTGPIGKQLANCENHPVVDFVPIPVDDLPAIDKDLLSTDQKYLYEIHESVSKGLISEDLAYRSPGNLNHARWLTTANRLLRLYVATETPNENLQSLCHFVMLVYIPMWFEIKTKPFVEDGPKHIFQSLRLVRKLPKNIQKIVKPIIERNAFFCHPENVLLSMISDERPTIRELGWRRIKKARENASRGSTVRKFILPKLNFDCDNYVSLINWGECALSEPPLTMGLTIDVIDNFILSKEKFECEKLPLHTQAVERVIKLVSEASEAVCSHEAREGFILSRISSRKRIPKFDSKRQYVPAH